MGLAARLRELGLPAWLLDSDLTKAYNTISRSWVTTTAIHLGFNAVRRRGEVVNRGGERVCSSYQRLYLPFLYQCQRLAPGWLLQLPHVAIIGYPSTLASIPSISAAFSSPFPYTHSLAHYSSSWSPLGALACSFVGGTAGSPTIPYCQFSFVLFRLVSFPSPYLCPRPRPCQAVSLLHLVCAESLR